MNEKAEEKIEKNYSFMTIVKGERGREKKDHCITINQDGNCNLAQNKVTSSGRYRVIGTLAMLVFQRRIRNEIKFNGLERDRKKETAYKFTPFMVSARTKATRNSSDPVMCIHMVLYHWYIRIRIEVTTASLHSESRLKRKYAPNTLSSRQTPKRWRNKRKTGNQEQ